MCLENAHLSIGILRESLEREGNHGAQLLYGLEVFSPAGADAALEALCAIRVSSNSSRRAQADAVNACKLARASSVAAA
jgi:hypothetical protein